MIVAERWRIALGMAASLTLHALALAALEIRRVDRLVVGSTDERVLEVSWWSGSDGAAESVASSTPRTAASPEATAPQPPAPVATAQGAEAVDLPEAPAVNERTAGTPCPVAANVGKPRPARTSEPRRDAPIARSRSADRHAPPAPKVRDVEGPDRPVPALGVATTTNAAAGGGRLGAPGPQSGSGSASDLAAYLARVRARIASHQPAIGGEQGRVGIRFDVAGDGSFSGVAAVSGDHGPLADAALRIVRRASPAPPIPPALRRGTIAMTLTIVFD